MSPQRQPATRPTRGPYARPCGFERKGRHDAPRPDAHDFPSPSSSKRGKREKKRKYDNFSPSVYDRLPQVYLTVRALRELDRRNSLKPRSTHTAEAHDFVSSDLSRFARRGGPNLSRIRNYSRAEDMASAGASGRKDLDDKSPQSKSQPKKSSAYDDNFEVILLEHDIFMELHQFPDDRMAPEPVNLEEVLKFVSRQRDSPSLEDFSKSDFLSFRRVNIATAEATIMVNVIPTIVGPPKAGNECGMVFTNLKSMTEGLTVRPVPDLFDGAQYGDVNIRIRRDLNEQIIPAKRASAPVLPNLFLEAKAGSGGADVARRQACYDGAYGARAMHALQNYGRAEGERVFDNMAYTYSAIYHAGASSLQIYAHHVASGPEGKPEYYMTKVCGFDMTNSMDTFIQGASAFRNARDLAKLHRDAFIKAANARAVKPAASAIAKGKRRAVAGDSGSNPAMQEPNCAQEVSVPTDEGEDEMAAARKGAKRLRRSASPEPGPANKKR